MNQLLLTQLVLEKSCNFLRLKLGSLDNSTQQQLQLL